MSSFLSSPKSSAVSSWVAKRRDAETQAEKLKIRQEELNANLEEIRARVDIDYNFYSEGAVTFFEKKQARNNSNRLLDLSEI